jgi:Skp family chaperone for outer membrane proteins
MMRAFFLGGAAAGLLALGVFLGLGLRSGPEAHAANRKESAPTKIGFVSCSELMLKSAEWQRGSKAMNEKQAALAKEIGEKQSASLMLKQRADAATDPTEKNRLAGELVETMRDLEDAQRKGAAKIQEEALAILQDLHKSFDRALKDEVRERSLDVVFGCPINPTNLFKNGKKPMNELELYFRPQAASPLYLAPELDITDAIAARMNADAETR